MHDWRKRDEWRIQELINDDWKDECMIDTIQELMNAWMKGIKDEKIKAWIKGYKNKWLQKWKEERKKRLMHEWRKSIY